MRYLCILWFLCFPSVVFAGGTLTPRPLDPVAAGALQRALASSELARALVATLESSNVIVHIQSSRQLPAGIGGVTRFVASRGGYRYVRIAIAVDLPPPARTAILAHELQHACEVAESRADDVASLRQLFARVGHRNGDFYETPAALRIERMVRAELSESRQVSSSRQAMQPPGK